jgi:ferredoxin-NADP reductase
MSILLGVIIGGLIASVAPITTIIADHLRWKRETKLIHLKSERDKLEQRFRETLEQLSKAMARNSYPAQMTSDIMIMLPKEVSDRYLTFLEEKDKSTPNSKQAYLEVAATMKECLATIDEQIEALVSN